MANTYTQSPEFAYITRLTKHGTKYAACGGISNRVLIAERASSGGVTYLGQSAVLTAEPLDIVSNGTPSAYYVLTSKGVTTLSAASAPAITAEAVFDTGGHPWMSYTAGGQLLVPLPQGGIRLLSTAGVTLADLCGVVSESTFGVLDGAVLYLFDGARGQLAFITVGASSLTYEGQISAPNCREILRAVIDGDRLYCLNRHRVVRFDITTALEPTLAQDYGLQSVTYTDAVVIGADKVWCGFAGTSSAQVGDVFLGSTFGVWNSTNSELNAAAPWSSAWGVNDVIPYFTAANFAPASPSFLLPAGPQITSSLALAVSVNAAWSYTITASGVTPVAFSSPSLPSWATLNAASGLVTGTPPTVAVVPITLVATNPGGTDTETLALTVQEPLAFFASIVLNGDGRSLLLVGNTLYVGGTFSSVTDSSGTYARTNLAALNLVTGLWTSFNPAPGNTVHALGTDGTHLYVGGIFLTVASGATARNRLARYVLATGALDAWNPNADSDVLAFHYDAAGDTLWVGGRFANMSGGARNRLAKFTVASTASPALGVFTTLFTTTTVLAIADAGSGILWVAGGLYDSTVGRRISFVGRVNGTTGAVDAHGISAADGGSSIVVVSGVAHFVGTMTSVGPWATPTANARGGGAAFSASMAIQAFDPLLGSFGSCIIADSVSTDLFIGGNFSAVNGDSTRKYLGRFSSSGALVSTFAPLVLTGTPQVYAMVRYGDAVLLAGTWTGVSTVGPRAFLTAVNATTGIPI